MTIEAAVLIEVTRGRLVECLHRGAVAVARPDGSLVLSLGDVWRPVFPRSAIKALQALPLIESGAADRFRLSAAEIALACASHSGSKAHVACAAAMLARAGRQADDLACGAHPPLEADELKALHRKGLVASALHNNCSGKHAGMICLACHLGAPVGGYLDIGHPVQKAIHRVLEEVSGETIGNEQIGIDGCSAPNFALPLAALARAFARLASGEGLSAARRAAARRIFESCWAAPDMVAGVGRLDTLLMSALPGQVFTKTGAEGVYCAALPHLGLGIAIKAEDGAKRASEATLVAVLERLVPGVGEIVPVVTEVKNWRGTVVGEVRAAGSLVAALDRMTV